MSEHRVVGVTSHAAHGHDQHVLEVATEPRRGAGERWWSIDDVWAAIAQGDRFVVAGGRRELVPSRCGSCHTRSARL